MTRLKELTEAELAEIAGLHNYTPREAAHLAWKMTGALAMAMVGALNLTVRWTVEGMKARLMAR